MPDVLGVRPEEYWDEARAKDYDSKKNIEKTQRLMTLKALEILGLEKGRVLDAGCGTGFSTRVIEEQGFESVGVDVAEEMVRLAERKGLEVVRADVSSLPFADESFDAFISVSALQWVTGKPVEVVEKYHEIVFELARVVRLGGVVQFYPSTGKEFELVKRVFRKKFFVEEVSAWTGRKAKTFLKLKKK